MRDDRGGVMTKLVIFLLVLGLAGWEAGAVLIARVQADSSASKAANEAAAEYSSTSSTTKARAAADEIVSEDGGTLVAFEVDPQNRTVTVTVQRKPRTVLIQRIGALKRYRTVEVTSVATIR